MKIASLLLASTLLTGGVAMADRIVVDSSVSSVVSDPGTRTRAVAGDDQGAYLIIERINDRGGVSDQLYIDALPLGRTNVPVAELKNIRLLSITQNTLQLEANPRTKGGNKMTIACTASLDYGRGKVNVTKANCTSGGQPYAPQGPQGGGPVAEPTVSMQQLEALSKTCDGAFSFDSERKKCLDLAVEAAKTSNFPASAGRAVTACKNAFNFASTRTQCMQTAYTSIREPAELVAWCAGKQSFESDRQACIAKYAVTR